MSVEASGTQADEGRDHVVVTFRDTQYDCIPWGTPYNLSRSLSSPNGTIDLWPSDLDQATGELELKVGDTVYFTFDPLYPAGGSRVIDLTRLTVDREWDALRDYILAARGDGAKRPGKSSHTAEGDEVGPTTIYPVVWFGRTEIASTPACGLESYRYSLALGLPNRSDREIVFDSIVFLVRHRQKDGNGLSETETARILISEGRAVTVHDGYHDHVELSPTRLALAKGLRFPHVVLGDFEPTVAGRQIVPFGVHLSLGGLAVSATSWCALPPLNRLPEPQAGSGAAVQCLPATLFPRASRMTESSVRGQVFHCARSFAKDALLHSVLPRRKRVLVARSEDLVLYLAGDWHCRFSSESRNCTFSVKVEDPGWICPEDIATGHLKKSNWLSEHHLTACRIDADVALMLCVQAGCRPGDRFTPGTEPTVAVESMPDLELTLQEVGGRWRCFWLLPFELPGVQKTAVAADNGELYTLRDNTWRPVEGSIWNSYSAAGL